MLVALSLRLYGLGDESLWLDEQHTLGLMKRGWSGITADATQGPLFLLLEKLFTSVTGLSESGLRAISVVFGVASVGALYRLALFLFTPAAALWAAWLMAVNPAMIHISQDARPYALMLFLASMCALYALRSVTRGNLSDRVAFVLCVAALVYTHAFGVFIFPMILALWWLHSRLGPMEYRKLIWPLVAVLLLCLPQLLIFGERFLTKAGGGEVALWIEEPSVATLFAVPYHFFRFPLLAGLLALFFVIGVYRSVARQSVPVWSIAVSTLFAIAFAFLPWLTSILLTPIFVFRYATPAALTCFLLLGFAVSESKPRHRIALAVALFLVSLFPLHSYYTKLDKEPWNRVADVLAEPGRCPDIILADRNYIAKCVKNYLPDELDSRVAASDSGEPLHIKLQSVNTVVRVSAYNSESNSPAVAAELNANWRRTDSIVYPPESDVNPYAVSWVSPITLSWWTRSEESQP